MVRSALRFLLLIVVLLAAWLVFALHSRPSVEAYRHLEFAEVPGNTGLRVTFLGVSTLLFRDSTAAVLIDGFFTRPGLFATAATRIAPDSERIANALARAGVDRLDAVVTVHSHYDHAMDAPEVARRTGAVVVGSPSTANIARGAGLAEDRIRIVTSAETLRFGDLSVTLIPSRHFPHGMATGEITSPLAAPVRATDYREGESFAVLVERDGKSVLVQASAGYVEGGLAGRHADVVYLGVGLLGDTEDDYRDAYWRETVTAVGARRVVPIHWDDFTRSLDEELLALPSLFDNLAESMEFITTRAAVENVDVRWPVLWQRTDPFAGL